MAASNDVRPIIKRKVVVEGDGHHGGAWKVAIVVPYSCFHRFCGRFEARLGRGIAILTYAPLL